MVNKTLRRENMKFLKNFIFDINLILLINIFVFADISVEKKNPIPPIDYIGTGGAGVASYGKSGMIFMNPASTAVDPDYWKIYIFNLGCGVNNELIEFFQQLSKISESDDENISSNKIDVESIVKLKALLAMQGPLSAGYVGKGFTFFVYDSLFNSLSLIPSTGLPYVSTVFLWDIGLMGGYSSKLPDEWIEFTKPAKIDAIYAGFLIKWIHRFKFVDERLHLLSLVDTFASMINNSSNKGFDYGNAFGTDLGTIIKWNNIGIGDIALGITLKDLFLPFFGWDRYNVKFQKIQSINSNTIFTPSFDIGVSYVFSEKYADGPWDFIFYRPSFYFDLVNSFDFSESFFNKVRMGAETKLFKFLALRMGLNKGYFSFGLGIEIPVLKLEFAYYTEEMGSYPGSNPVQIYMLNMALMIP
jgi:hypothetical protein